MRYVVLATGFDGTLARDGRCDARSIAMLRALSESGRKLILVTSRQLRDILDAFPQANLFDYLVAENGAVVHRPAARESEILAPAPSELLVHELRRRGIHPVTVGSVAITTSSHHRELLAELVERLRLDCYISDNGDTVAVVPTGVDKASGVERALEELGLSPHNLVSLGDAENDLALFELAEHGVATANASAVLKRIADRVTRAGFSEGFAEFASELLDTDLLDAPTRHRIVLGTRAGHEVSVPPATCSILISGPVASGNAAMCNNVVEQYMRQRYQCCVIGAFPDASAEEMEGLSSFGDEHHPPKIADVVATLEKPNESVLVNLTALRSTARAHFVEQLIPKLESLQVKAGRPHAVVLEGADGLLSESSAMRFATLRGTGVVYVTSSPQTLPRITSDCVDIVVAIGDAGRAFETIADAPAISVEQLEPGQALAWFRRSGTSPFRIDLLAATFDSLPDSALNAAVRARQGVANCKNEVLIP